LKRRGRKSAAQTPAPSKERVYGSSKNPSGSAASKSSASKIKLSKSILDTLKEKAKKYNESHKKDVSTSTLKAVMRRGMGAYSKSHRPTITGGAPNSRQAWGFARVNKFLKKKSGEPVKKAYVQDDDLMARGGKLNVLKEEERLGIMGIEETHKYLNKKFKSYKKENAEIEDLPDIYIRAGLPKIKKDGTFDVSKNGFTGEKEKGVSVFKAKYSPNSDFVFVDLTGGWGFDINLSYRDSQFYDEIEDYPKSTSKMYLVDGESVGYGSDGETVLNPKTIKVIGLLNPYKVIPPKYFSKQYIGSNQHLTFGGKFISEYPKYESGGMTNDLPVGKLAKGMSLSEVAAKHGLSADALKSELMLGIETEKEHTDNPDIARAIALDHLFEDPKYYTKLKQMEGIDSHLTEISDKYAKGGSIAPIFSFTTPTGEKSTLTYLQQVLVRTKSFKQFFGDWEKAAKNFLADNKQNFAKHFQDVSVIMNWATLEPRVVYHGTRSEDEFFRFDVNKDKGVGRPYGYFAHNREYSENFTTSSQRSARNSKPYLYEVFIDVRKPFYANTDSFIQKNKDANGWKATIASAIAIQKYAPYKPTKEEVLEIDMAVDSQIGKYIDSVFASREAPFWKLMAADVDKDFKYFLMSYGFDGILYGEEFQSNFDADDPAQYTYAVTIFDSKQVKLADGRNLNFDPLIDDIRYEEGGHTEESEPVEEKSLDMNKKMKLGALLFGDKYAEGGEVIDAHGNKTNDGKRGGYFKGRSHAEGGIKAINKDTGQLIEVEGNEVIITKKAVADDTLREFEGEQLTNKQILSKINQSGGGVAFEEGGELSEGEHTCGCTGKKFNYGGQLMEDYNILRSLNDPYDASKVAVNKARSLVDDLISKMK